MADNNGVMSEIEIGVQGIGSIFGVVLKIFPVGFIFIFLFGGNIFNALIFIGCIWFFNRIIKIGNALLKKPNNKRRYNRAK